jgi:hypothetical protein
VREGAWVDIGKGRKRLVYPDQEPNPRRTGHRSWPRESDCGGVPAERVQEAMQANRELGVPTEYARPDETGWCRAVLTGPGHRKRFFEARRWFDKDGGYGDPQRR